VPGRLARILTIGVFASWIASCGSSPSSSPANQEASADASASTPGASDSGSGDASGADVVSPIASDSGGPDARSGGDPGGDGGPRPEGGTVWQPTTAAPIHFHWMIGASSFTSGDILSGQNGPTVYDIDGANATAGAVAICYVEVGSLEQGRPDYAKFPSSVIGPAVQGWPGENWLLVTAANQSVILPLMKARFVDWCQAKGFDAIEPDNLDAWTNSSGVTETDNIAYDLAIGQLAHALPLSIGLKNVMTDVDPSQYASFVALFDWALNEQCYEYDECNVYSASGSFLPAAKAVFDVEYNVAPSCTQADAVHMNAQETDLDLVGATDQGYQYTPCVPDSQATW
jgi:hypothetical protein